jgi:phage terminase large subunit GpA-like protein
MLSPENSAEAGRWRTSRTPYMKEIMDAFTDPRVDTIAVVASSQVGKTESLYNMIGYMIDQDPGGALYVVPTKEYVQDISKRRIAPMIRDTDTLRDKVADAKGRSSGNTISQKTYPGGMLSMIGSNSATDLAGHPIRYVFADEIDRWAKSAGTEGDPWSLLERRTNTFYNAKMVAVSTPTIRGASKIEDLFNLGTKEYWCVKCPECGEYTFIDFNAVRYDFHTIGEGKKKQFVIDSTGWACPECGCYADEQTIKRQPMKWLAKSPEAIRNGCRSFWINGFYSPWLSWEKIIIRFLEAGKDPEKLQPVFNTLFGQLWDPRGEIEDEDELASRAEEYGAELPDGVLVLTMGVDTQDNRLEYEVVGYGLFEENWGIEKGIIDGNPASPETWEKLDGIIDRVWHFRNGKGLKISLTFVDEGGHYTQEVRYYCAARKNKRVFAIKGQGGEGVPFTAPAKQGDYSTAAGHTGKYWYYMIGVDSGKEHIMSGLKVREPGARMSHFPKDWGRGYDALYYSGLLSEHMTLQNNGKWKWEKLPGHDRNEALDCRNYANAAFRVLHPNLDAVKQKLAAAGQKDANIPKRPARIRKTASEEW